MLRLRALLLLPCSYDRTLRMVCWNSKAWQVRHMVFETLGAVNVEGEEVLKQLFRFASKRLGREFTSYCGRAWARVSCNLQRSVSQEILNRICGHQCNEDDL